MVEIRGLVPDDINFVISTWIRGQRFGSEYFKAMDPEAYYASHKQFITSILSSPCCSIRVACDLEDKDLIYSYVVVWLNDDDVHNLVWAWSRPSFRKQGFINKLLYGLTIGYVGSLTEIGDRIRTAKNLKFKVPDVR